MPSSSAADGASVAQTEEVDLVAAAAAAASLREGTAGAWAVLRAIVNAEPVPVREISLAAGLPVPVVAALCGELRARGIVEQTRPVRLTDLGRQLAAPLRSTLRPRCSTCDATGIEIQPGLDPLRAQLRELEEGSPPAQVEIDQTHCTVDTKLRRALFADGAGAIGRRRVLLLGDDDLTSLAIALVGLHGGSLPEELVVLDIDPAVTGYVRDRSVDLGRPVRTVEHDVREELPEELRARFGTVITDPPYTLAGVELFLRRASSALSDAPGLDVLLFFGPKAPDEMLAIQAVVTELGFVIHQLIPNFSSYLGAGILAGTSHLFWLKTTTDRPAPEIGRFDGPLYTGDRRRAPRVYECNRCGAQYLVGPGAPWSRLADLKAVGCGRCGGDRFRPRSLAPVEPAQPGQ